MAKSLGQETEKRDSSLAGAEISPTKQGIEERRALAQDSAPDLGGSTLKTSVQVERKPTKPLLSQLRQFKEQKNSAGAALDTKAKRAAVAPNPSLAELRRQIELGQNDDPEQTPNVIDKIISFLAAILKKIELNLIHGLNQRRANNRGAAQGGSGLKDKKSGHSSAVKIKRS